MSRPVWANSLSSIHQHYNTIYNSHLPRPFIIQGQMINKHQKPHQRPEASQDYYWYWPLCAMSSVFLAWALDVFVNKLFIMFVISYYITIFDQNKVRPIIISGYDSVVWWMVILLARCVCVHLFIIKTLSLQHKMTYQYHNSDIENNKGEWCMLCPDMEVQHFCFCFIVSSGDDGNWQG